MTKRALLLSLLGAVFIPTAGYYADHVAHVNRFVAGQLPIMAYGPLVLVVLFLNPLIKHFRPSTCFRKQELALIMIGLFVGASITNNGLLRYFTRCLVTPIYMERTKPGWQERKVLDDVPPAMMANDAKRNEEMEFGFIRGKGEADRMIPFKDVPWRLWAKTLTFWGTILILFGIASISLAMIVHPQWSRHELLRYPTAAFATELMGEAEDGRPIYMQRPFIVAASLLLAYHLLNGSAKWFPDYVIGMPNRFDFSPLSQVFPFLKSGWNRAVLRPAIWPIAVALAYFLSRDVSLSVGLSQPVAAVVFSVLVSAQLVSSGGNFITGQAFHWQRAGSSIALVLMIFYIGRRYYMQVAKSAVLFKPPDDKIGPVPIRAFRVLLVTLAILVVILMTVAKLQWPFAIGFVLLTMIAFLTVSRIIAEVGIFYVQIIWFPVAIFLGLFGGYALGPTALVSLALLSTIFVAQPEEALMPFVTQGLKIGDSEKKPALGRFGTVAVCGFALAILIGVPFALWVDYSYGGATKMRWDAYGQPSLPFQELARVKLELAASDRVEESKGLSSLQRLAAIHPKKEFLWTLCAGFVLVVATYMARLRWPKWPIHPVMFLIWNTWASSVFFFSFLLAWVLRVVMDRVGVRGAEKTMRQIMVGVITGELLGGMLWMVIGWIYSLYTGERPPYYNIFPY